ncbi:unnamed protein product [Parascedosporium putredinis]|uniref:Lysine-specific metallo-endopeptidase domain-containing protein n=1 Tax=Parascedosporium putredinis TaxID=1442378 RepID=A0A9P1H151_9PEZI|nr:unnamed protein product [Parascedosporium putredinis]CAI7992401.1 unnamed protein product [Parascedosporium putredinis]
MTEALNMAQLAVNRRNDEEMSAFLGLIYPGINDNQKGTLFDDIEKIATLTPAGLGESPNIIIYCDDDSRWRHATAEEIPGQEGRTDAQKAWIDPENDIVFDQRVDPRSLTNLDRQIPGCREVGTATRAQTYTNLRTPTPDHDRGSIVTITLCSRALTGPKIKYLTIGEIAAENLASRKASNLFKLPNIDTFKLLSATVVHELSHQILTSAIRYDDVRGANSYRWPNISNMDLLSGLENADSLAYTCIAAMLMEMGYSVDKDGDIKKKKT